MDKPDEAREAVELRIAKIIDGEAWEAIADGRDKPDTLWHLRRQFAIDKAEAIISALTTSDAREKALEEAAKAVEAWLSSPATGDMGDGVYGVCCEIVPKLAAAVRALKSHPAPRSGQAGEEE